MFTMYVDFNSLCRQLDRRRFSYTTYIIIAYIILTYSVKYILAIRNDVIDVDTDIRFGWKVKGEFIYLPTGHQLQGIASKLPPGFSFNSITSTRGIWAVFPDSEPDSIINFTSFSKNEASFAYSTSAQLLSSLTLRHNSGGQNATIKIITAHHNITLTPEKMFSGWVDITIELEGTSRFRIEAIANAEHDYILIDRIEATYLETTTPTRPTDPTTTITTPKPKNGETSLELESVNYYAILLWLFVVMYF